MIFKVLNISLLAVLISGASIVSAQKNEWNLKKDKNDITVYTREDEATGNIEFKASTTFETNIDTLINVFKDIEGYTKWMADIKVSKILQKNNKTECYIYFEMKAPWPLKNRDLPVYQTINRTDKGAEISLFGKPNYIPHKKGIVRIEMAIGSWKFISMPDNKVKIIYQYMADPGLNVPKWVINLFIVDGPFKTLTNLKKL